MLIKVVNEIGLCFSCNYCMFVCRNIKLSTDINDFLRLKLKYHSFCLSLDLSSSIAGSRKTIFNVDYIGKCNCQSKSIIISVTVSLVILSNYKILRMEWIPSLFREYY